MNTVRITAIRQTVYPDLIAQREPYRARLRRPARTTMDLYQRQTSGRYVPFGMGVHATVRGVAGARQKSSDL